MVIASVCGIWCMVHGTWHMGMAYGGWRVSKRLAESYLREVVALVLLLLAALAPTATEPVVLLALERGGGGAPLLRLLVHLLLLLLVVLVDVLDLIRLLLGPGGHLLPRLELGLEHLLRLLPLAARLVHGGRRRTGVGCVSALLYQTARPRRSWDWRNFQFKYILIFTRKVNRP